MANESGHTYVNLQAWFLLLQATCLVWPQAHTVNTFLSFCLAHKSRVFCHNECNNTRNGWPPQRGAGGGQETNVSFGVAIRENSATAQAHGSRRKPVAVALTIVIIRKNIQKRSASICMGIVTRGVP